MSSQINWKTSHSPLGGVNYVLDCGDFHISFNPNPSATILGRMFGSDDGGPETALCKEDAYFILNGDFRETYERLSLEGFDACKRFYDQQAAHADSSWSTSGLGTAR